MAEHFVDEWLWLCAGKYLAIFTHGLQQPLHYYPECLSLVLVISLHLHDKESLHTFAQFDYSYFSWQENVYSIT